MERMDTSALAAELLSLERRRQQAPLEEGDAAQHQALMAQLFERLHQAPGSERRRYLRIPADLEAKFRLGQATITCGATELSLDGLSLRGQLWVIDQDQDLLLENLRLEGAEDYPVKIKSKVLWKISDEDSQPRAGLQFVEMDEESKHKLRAVFERLFVDFLEQLHT